MKTRGFTLIEIMIVAAIIALLAGVAVPNLLKARMAANDAAAEATVHSLATAAEVFAISHNGKYPTVVGAGGLHDFILSSGNYCTNVSGGQTSVQGFKYACTLTSGGYTFVAKPIIVGRTGSTTYTASTGCVITPFTIGVTGPGGGSGGGPGGCFLKGTLS